MENLLITVISPTFHIAEGDSIFKSQNVIKNSERPIENSILESLKAGKEVGVTK